MISPMILFFICLVPILLIVSVIVWWAFIRGHQRRWLVIAVLCWLGAHGVFFLPFRGLANAFVVLYGLILGVPVAMFCALTMFDRRNDYFRIATLLIWLLTPLTLPGIIIVRDLPFSEQFGKCYIEKIGMSIESYKQQQQRYPSVIGGDTFDDNYSLLGELRSQCFAASAQPVYQNNVVSMVVMYQQQGDSYYLGGYYRYFLLDLFGLTRVCHYNQSTQDATCGFNNWAPFTPP